MKVSKWYLSSDPFESHLNGVYRSRIWRGVQGIGDEDRARRHDRRLSKAASERDLSFALQAIVYGAPPSEFRKVVKRLSTLLPSQFLFAMLTQYHSRIVFLE